MTTPSERAKEIVDNLLVWLGGGDKDRSPEQIAAQIDAFAAEAVRAERASLLTELTEWADEIADVWYSIDRRDWIKCHEDEMLAAGIRKACEAIRARTPASGEDRSIGCDDHDECERGPCKHKAPRP